MSTRPPVAGSSGRHRRAVATWTSWLVAAGFEEVTVVPGLVEAGGKRLLPGGRHKAGEESAGAPPPRDRQGTALPRSRHANRNTPHLPPPSSPPRPPGRAAGRAGAGRRGL